MQLHQPAAMIQNRAKGTVWVDVTTILRWDRPVVGVVRVEEQLARWILSHRKESVRFCRYDQSLQSFLVVTPDEVASQLKFYEHLKRHDNASTNTASLSPLPKRSRRGKRRSKPKKAINAALRFFIDRLWRRNVAAHRDNAPAQFVAPALVKPDLSIFHSGDVYVSVGADWGDKDLQRLEEHKKAIGFSTLGICYDAIPIKFPHLTLPTAAKMFPQYIVDVARVHDHVMCISRCTEADFKGVLVAAGAAIPCTSLLTLGSDLLSNSPHTKAPIDVSVAVSEAANRPFLLYVSTIERRKNHETLYKVWVRLSESRHDLANLVFVGNRGWGITDLLEDISLDPRIRDRIFVLHDVSDVDLAYLYKRCLFTLYPSLYEGWGLPVVESLAFGKFCLCSNAGSLMEAGGSLAEYLDPWDVAAWSNRIRYLIEHPEEVATRNRIIETSFRPHPWSETSRSILERAETMVVNPTRTLANTAADPL